MRNKVYNNSNSNGHYVNVYSVVIVAETATARVKLVYLVSAARAPGSHRPLDQAIGPSLSPPKLKGTVSMTFLHTHYSVWQTTNEMIFQCPTSMQMPLLAKLKQFILTVPTELNIQSQTDIHDTAVPEGVSGKVAGV